MIEANKKTKTVWIINQYASTPETGIGGRHYYFANELAKQGYKVYLIMAGYTHWLRTPPILTEKFTKQDESNFQIIWIKMPQYEHAHSKQRVLNWFNFAFKLRKMPRIISEKPDVILYSSMSLIGFLGAKYLAKKSKARLVFEVRDIWPLSLVELGGYSVKHPFVRFLQWVEDKAYRDSDAVISNLKNAVVHMVSRGMTAEKFTWIPNGFCLDEVCAKQPLDKSILCQLPKNKFIIGYTGSIGKANALDTLVSTAALLKDYDDIAFVIVGQGQFRESLQTSVATMNLQNVFFIDPIPKKQVQSIINEFSICYIGLVNESLFRFGVSPNKLFEYLYSSKPIIYAIDSGDYKPVEEYQAGIQILPEDVEATKAAVLSLYTLSDAERKIIGQNGREAALNYYEYSSLAKQLEMVLFPKANDIKVSSSVERE